MCEFHHRESDAKFARLLSASACLGAYHDGYIEFHSSDSISSVVSSPISLGQGHGDWRYDEFRLDEKDGSSTKSNGLRMARMNTWLIVAFRCSPYRWIPFTKAETGDAGS